MKRALLVLLVVLYLAHDDVWLRYDATLVAGLPIGLIYHVAYCAAATILMSLLVKHAWPLTTLVDER